MGKNFLKSSLQNATFNIIYQIGFRIVTFLLNAFVLRHISQAVVGVMNVRLLLLESTILFLSREAFRRACLSKTTEHNWPQVINLLWLTVPVCCLMCGFFGWIWLNVLSPPDEMITKHYALGVWSICLSCIMEMCVEPLYLASEAFLFVKFKVVLSTLTVTVRTVLFTVLVLWRPNVAVVAFSVAQVVAVLVYTLIYCFYFKHYMEKNKKDNPDDFPFNSLHDFFPKKINGKPVVDFKLCSLTWSFWKQGVLKQLLTEGERYIMTLFSVLTFTDQGIYDVVNNLGSLAARFLFRPIEDSAYFYFSQMIHRDKSILDQNQSSVSEAVLVLRQLLRFVGSVGLVVLSFGIPYSRLVLYLYGGRTLAEDGPGTSLLRAHSFAIILLAINGTTECYAMATMNTKQIDRYNYVMAFLSVIFLLVSWLLTIIFGSIGFILANCCNMLARIVHSVQFIQERYKDTGYDPLNGIVPSRLFLSSLMVSCFITMVSEIYLYDDSKVSHFLIGAICFVFTFLIWLLQEYKQMRLCFQRVRRESLKQE